MASVFPPFDPDAALRGEAREAAMLSYRAAVAELVECSVRDMFAACCRLPEGKDLGIGDAVPIIEDALQVAVDQMTHR
jgi:hypothetical protein